MNKKEDKKDYYGVLKVGRKCNKDDLKKAYQKLAMKWHPFKNLLNRDKAMHKFQRINEAYEVLGDVHKRSIFDTYGEAGLKGSIPEVGTGNSRFFHGRKHKYVQIYSTSSEDVFVEFWGGTSPFAGMSGNLNPRGHKCLKPIIPNLPPKNTCAAIVPIETSMKKSAPILNRLICTLEDLSIGCIKKIKIARNLLDQKGKSMSIQEVLTIEIKPGWKKGTKITFLEKGNQQPGMIPADLVFLVDEKKHPTFIRDGDDLIAVRKINLSDALVGLTVTLTTPDYRILNIPCIEIIRPGFEKIVHKEGMPLFREPGKKGNLILRFVINFPTKLTNEQKTNVKKCLPDDAF